MMVQSMAGRWSVVRCVEPLDAQGSARLRTLFTGTVQRARRVILDLSASAYADSAGLRELLALQQYLQTEGAELRLIVPPGSRIDRTLRLVGFASLFSLYPNARLAWRQKSSTRGAPGAGPGPRCGPPARRPLLGRHRAHPLGGYPA
jgi:anti-anti-sigma factor